MSTLKRPDVLSVITAFVNVLQNPITRHSFFPGLDLPFLQILPTVAFPFYFRTDSTDSPDCLPILLSIAGVRFLRFGFLLSTFYLLVPCGR